MRVNTAGASYTINGIYPVSNLYLAGTGAPDDNGSKRFWASKSNYAAVDPNRPGHYSKNGEETSEVLEIPLGRARQVNYISFSTLACPMRVELCYASFSQNGEVKWCEVTPVEGMPFTRLVQFDPNRSHPYQSCEMHFTDAAGRLIDTDLLRLRFIREDTRWPSKNTGPFPWNVIVRDLRVARTVDGEKSLHGRLLDASVDGSRISRQSIRVSSESKGSSPVVQKFVFSEAHKRGEVMPDVSGFSFVAYVPEVKTHPSAVFDWALYNESTGDLIESGSARPAEQTPPPSDSWTTSALWVNVDLKHRRAVNTSDTYSVRVTSRDADLCSDIGVAYPNKLSSHILSGLFTFSNGSTTITFSSDALDPRVAKGQYIRNSTDYGVAACKISDVVFDPVHNTGTITLETRYGGVSGSNQTAEIVFPVSVESPTFRPEVFFNVTNGSPTITYAGSVNLNSYFVSGDEVRLAGSIGSFYTVAGVNYNATLGTGAITLSTNYTGPTASLVSLEGRHVLSVNSDASLALRVWGTVGDDGQDILGNNYRSVAMFDTAAHATDPSGRGWMSAPQPSPNAVECLYFDVSQQNEDGLGSAIDAIRLTPVTPGVTMNVYTSMELPFGADNPVFDKDAYDKMVWTPAGSFRLDGETTVALRRRAVANYIKLEFTNLRPLPFAFSTTLELPEKEYSRFPTWIENLQTDPIYNSYRRVVEDWFVQSYRSNKRVQSTKESLLAGIKDSDQLALADFSFKNRLFLTDLADATKKAQIARLVSSVVPVNKMKGSTALPMLDIDGAALIDPYTKSAIRFTATRQWTQPITASIDPTTLLGQTVARANTLQRRSSPVETFVTPDRTNFVSTPDPDRVSVSYAVLTALPIAWDRTCTHAYRIESGRFNGVAYFAGIQNLKFLSSRHAVLHDDEVIVHNPLSHTEHTDGIEGAYGLAYYTESKIPDNVFVTYTTESGTVVDEPVHLPNYEDTALSSAGVVEAITVRDKPSTDPDAVMFSRGTDFSVFRSYNTDGTVVTSIARAALPQRVLFNTGDATEYYDGDQVQLGIGISGVEA